MIDRRAILAAAATASLVAGPALADDAGERCLHEDWPWLDRWRTDNARVIAEGMPVDVVFMGDSITEGWLSKRPDFFKTGRICRGIGGQTTPQMVLRMMADVVQLKPKAVHIMAGTNDIAGNTGPMTFSMTTDNYDAMSNIARARHSGALGFCSAGSFVSLASGIANRVQDCGTEQLAARLCSTERDNLRRLSPGARTARRWNARRPGL